MIPIKKIIRIYGLLNQIEREGKMNPKKWFFSKTIWANAVSLVLILIDHFAGMKLIPADVAAAAVAALNVLLRIVTKQPIK